MAKRRMWINLLCSVEGTRVDKAREATARWAQVRPAWSDAARVPPSGHEFEALPCEQDGIFIPLSRRARSNW